MNDVSARTNFDRFLTLLDADRDAAGARYEELRVRLVRFFEWRGSSNGDDLADVCFDRVLRKIGGGEQIENVAAYAATVAQFVYKESLRSKERVTDSLDADDARDVAAAGDAASEDPRMACLDRCLGEFQADDRNLVVAYYDTEEKTMIASRKRLADSLAMSMNTLRIKVCRLKAKLEKCTKDCCKSG